jgi:hypothetical protein
MKKLAALVFFVFMSTINIAQVVAIQVNEVQSFFGDPTWDLDQVLRDPYYSNDPIKKDCRYVIDFNESTVTFYRNGEMIETGPVQILTVNCVSIIKILEEGFDFGLIVDFRLQKESIFLYQIHANSIECMKFTDFQIIKAS